MQKIRILPCLLLFFCLHACDENESKNENPSVKSTSKRDSLIALIQSNPDSLLLKENLLQLYRDSGLYEKAIQTNLDYIKKDSLNPRLYHIMGLLYLENEDTLPALNAFSRSYNIYNNPTDLIYAAAIYAKKKDSKALIITDTLLKTFYDKSAKEAWLIKGVYFSGIGQSAKALFCFDSSIQIRFSFTEAYVEKAMTLKNIKKYKLAIETLNKAVTINNNLPDAYVLMGECYEELKDTESAIAAYDKALMYDAENPDARGALKRLIP